MKPYGGRHASQVFWSLSAQKHIFSRLLIPQLKWNFLLQRRMMVGTNPTLNSFQRHTYKYKYIWAEWK